MEGEEIWRLIIQVLDSEKKKKKKDYWFDNSRSLLGFLTCSQFMIWDDSSQYTYSPSKLYNISGIRLKDKKSQTHITETKKFLKYSNIPY